MRRGSRHVVRVRRLALASSSTWDRWRADTILGRDGFVVDYFLGTVRFAAATAAVAAVQAILDAGDADPAALRLICRELVPFYCPDCELNYCGGDWNAEVLWDEGFYDRTLGTCPHGHHHVLDD